MQKNFDVKQRHHHKSIYEKSIVDWTIPRLTLYGIVKSLAYMNLELFYMINTPSHHLLKNYTTEHKKDHSWVIQTAELQ